MRRAGGREMLKVVAEKAKAEGTKEGHRGGCCLELEIALCLKQIRIGEGESNSSDSGRERRSSAGSGVPKPAVPCQRWLCP